MQVALEVALEVALSGHDFSHADSTAKITTASAAEVLFPEFSVVSGHYEEGTPGET